MFWSHVDGKLGDEYALEFSNYNLRRLGQGDDFTFDLMRIKTILTVHLDSSEFRDLITTIQISRSSVLFVQICKNFQFSTLQNTLDK